MTFTYGNLKTLAKLADPNLGTMDATEFAARSDINVKRAFAAYEKTLEDANDPFGKGSILDEVSPASSGTEVVNTTVADMFKVALIAAARKIAEDSIFVYNATTAEFERAARTDIDDIVTSGASATVLGFQERQGFFDLYVKQGTFATGAPMEIQYLYWRHLTAPALDADALDLKAADFDAVFALYLGYMTA